MQQEQKPNPSRLPGVGPLLPALTRPAQNLVLPKRSLCTIQSLGGARAPAITRGSRVPPSIPAPGRRPPRNCVLQYPRWLAYRAFFSGLHNWTKVRVELQLSETLSGLRYLGGAWPELLAWAKSQCLCLEQRPDFGHAGPRPPGSPAPQSWLAFSCRPLQVPSQALPSAAQIHFSNTAAKDRRTPHHPLKIRPPDQTGTRTEERMFPSPGSLASTELQLGATRLIAQRLERCGRSWVGGGGPDLRSDLIWARTEHRLASTLQGATGGLQNPSPNSP